MKVCAAFQMVVLFAAMVNKLSKYVRLLVFPPEARGCSIVSGPKTSVKANVCVACLSAAVI